MRPDAPSDPTFAILELDRGPVAYTDEGAGIPVVAVHGIPGSLRDFRWLAAAASPDMRVLRLDLPGFGETPERTCPAFDVGGRSEVVAAFIEKLELGPVVVVGHSMGGVVATHLAVTFPGIVRHLVLIATPGLTPHRGLERLPIGVMTTILRSKTRARLLEPITRRLFTRAGFRGPYPPGAYRRTVLSIDALRFDEHAQNVQRLDRPTTVVWCDDDPLIESQISEGLARACPEGPRLRFADGGHNPQKHHAVEIARVLASALH